MLPWNFRMRWLIWRLTKSETKNTSDDGTTKHIRYWQKQKKKKVYLFIYFCIFSATGKGSVYEWKSHFAMWLSTSEAAFMAKAAASVCHAGAQGSPPKTRRTWCWNRHDETHSALWCPASSMKNPWRAVFPSLKSPFKIKWGLEKKTEQNRTEKKTITATGAKWDCSCHNLR